MDNTIRVIDDSIDALQQHKQQRRQDGFHSDALTAITTQLLTVQTQCKVLEEENSRIGQLLQASNKFAALAKKRRPTPGQVAVENAFQHLEQQIKEGHKKTTTIVQTGHRDTAARNIKVMLASLQEKNARLEATLAEEQAQHERIVNDLQQHYQDSSLKQQLDHANQRNAILQQQYTKLYEFCQNNLNK